MHTSAPLHYVRDYVLNGESDRALRRATTSGSLIRVRRGAYARREEWSSLDSPGRYRTRIEAVVRTRRERPVLGFESAAAIWGCDRWGDWPAVVHLVVDPGSGPTRSKGVLVHRSAVDRVVERDGFLVTDYPRTLVDLARTMPFVQSVVALDQSMNRDRVGELAVNEELLLKMLASSTTSRGRAKALLAIRFADGEAFNGGESYSRALMHGFGFPTPKLQSKHPNPRGGNYFTDFEWPEFRLVGEFDGRSKYLKPEYLGRLTPGEAVVEEKIREDHIRARGFRFVRWGVPELRQPERLRAVLLDAGLPERRIRAR